MKEEENQKKKYVPIKEEEIQDRLAKMPDSEKAKRMFIMKKKKPNWITEEQWRAVPSIAWWKDSKSKSNYLKQSKPVTSEEALKQISRLRTSKNWNQGV